LLPFNRGNEPPRRWEIAVLLFDDEVTQPAEEWSFGYAAATGPDPGSDGDDEAGDDEADDDERSDPGGDSDAEPDPARR